MEKAIFAAGCFWGIEAAFRKIKGVRATKVGYTGGNFENPTYEDTCSGITGHAEAIEIKFDPTQISYDKLLQTFWKIHNPTTKDRQGWDIGKQYRSGIFYLNDKQKKSAEASMKALEESGKYSNPIVTEITKASKFWVAEQYHQKYLEKRGKGTCGV